MFDYDTRPATPLPVLVGGAASRDAYAIRDFLSRNGYPFEWVAIVATNVATEETKQAGTHTTSRSTRPAPNRPNRQPRHTSDEMGTAADATPAPEGTASSSHRQVSCPA